MRMSIAIFAVLAYSSASNAQAWKQLGNLPSAMYCSYFFDQNHGVVAGVGAIWRYNFGSWTTPTVPSDPSSFYFTSIRMLKPGVLYATSGATYVWFSTDSGATWQNTTTAGSFALDCYLDRDSVHATFQGAFAQLDSNICIVSNNNGTVPSYSTNGGTTWTTPSSSYTIGGYGTYADTCRKMFFACAKTGGPAYYSIDSGHTWHPTGSSDSCDILNGADGSVYHQVSYGVLCSIDGGTHWQFIGGPDAYGVEHSIFGFGDKGKYIVATHIGQVWLYSKTDTLLPPDPVTRPDTTEICPILKMPVTITPYTRPLQVTMESSSIGPQSLSPSDTTFTLQAGTSFDPLPSPSKTILFNVNPTNAQHPSYITFNTSITDGCRMFSWTDTFTIFPVPLPISTPNVQIQNCTVSRIPLVIQPNTQALRMHVTISADSGWSVLPAFTNVELPSGSRDTIWITPTAPSSGVGTVISIYATDTSSCTVYTWDTTFTVSITPVPVTFSRLDTIRITSCDSVRIPILLDLASCDSLNIDQMTLLPVKGANAPLTFESALNLPLTRGQTDTIWMLYAPHGLADSTNYQIKIAGHFIPEGIAFDTVLNMTAVSSGTIYPRAAAAATLAIKECTPVSLPITIKAAGCEDIRIDSIVFNNSGLITTGGPTAIDTIPGGQTDTLHYTVEALYPVARFLDIDCYLYRLTSEEPFDTIISITLNISGTGEQPLISVPATLNLSNCTTSVVPIVLHAPCDSLTISECDLTVAKGLNYTTNLTFPQKFDAEQSDSLLVSFPPQDLNQTTVIYSEIKGTYGGSTATFDTVVHTQVTFVCLNGVTEEGQSGPPLAISGLQSTGGQLQFALSKNDPNIVGCEAEIVSVLGETVAKRSLPLTSSDNQINWDLNGLPSGEYFLRIVSGDYRLSSRFVLVR